MNQIWAFFSFKGRMRRRDYWLYSLPVLLVLLPVFIYTDPGNATDNVALQVLSLMIFGFAFWASAALNVKRLHDRNKSGWWVIVTFLPIIGPIFVIVELGVLDGTKGPNQFGADPKKRGEPPADDSDANKDTMTIDI